MKKCEIAEKAGVLLFVCLIVNFIYRSCVVIFYTFPQPCEVIMIFIAGGILCILGSIVYLFTKKKEANNSLVILLIKCLVVATCIFIFVALHYADFDYTSNTMYLITRGVEE